MHSQSFTQYLHSELIERTKRNPRYSLRSFAASLDLDPSYLCKILNQKRPVSPALLLSLSERLSVDPSLFTESRRRQGDPARDQGQSLKLMQPETFNTIGDWFHFATLELFNVSRFVVTPTSVAKALGINLRLAKETLDQLVAAGLVTYSAKQKTWAPVSQGNSTVQNIKPTRVMTDYQRQVLQQAQIALDHVPISQRDQSSLVLAMDPKLLPAAKTILADARRQLRALYAKSSRRTQVYQVSLSVFPLIQNKENS